MASRAYWKGYLKLSLVTCPVALYPASSKSEKTRFHQINKKTGHRLRQQMVDEDSGRVVETENKGRGYELTKGKYVEIEPEEIDAIEFENTHTIDIDKFVPEEEIDKRYYERPYYIVPDGKSGEEAFAVIRDAMKDKGRVALAGIIFANRQHILAIEPWGKGMLGTTLRYDYEVRDEKEFFRDIRSHNVPKEMVSLASHILDSKAGHFDPAKFKDEYELALRLTIFDPTDMPGPLFDLKLTDLPGINTRMEARLRDAGIKSVEAFYRIEPKHARKVWGSVGGERFWYLLHGYDLPDQETSRSSIGHSRVLDPELRNPEAALQVARRLTIKAAARLLHQEFHATRFALSVRGDEERWDGETRVSPSQDNFSFLGALHRLWAEMMASMHPRKLKKVAVTLYGLCKREEITPDLFDMASPAYQKVSQRNDALSVTMDRLNDKYGAETIRLGVSPKTSAGFVGTKIAFSRVPDLTEFKN